MVLSAKLRNRKLATPCTNYGTVGENMESGVLFVAYDPLEGNCQIFEIKHSTEAVKSQYRHLIDEEKCALTEHRYGLITAKTVLYRGEDQIIEGIQYRNVERYLVELDCAG